MKKNVGLLLAILLFLAPGFCQDEYIQRPTLGIFFFFNDFKTAELIRATSLRQVLRNSQFGKLREMLPGLALNYMNGLNAHFDFSTTLTGSFIDYNTPGGVSLGQDNL